MLRNEKNVEQEIFALERACFDVPYTLEQISDELRLDIAFVLMIDSAGVIRRFSPDADGAPALGSLTGYLTARLLEADGLAELLRIAVRPGSRRCGLGERLLAELETHVCRTFCLPAHIQLEVAHTNIGALGFYRALGFQEIHVRRAYYRDGADAIILQKKFFRE